MNKKCARAECGKTVYPIEELRCLNKLWHKGCFKCTSCGMTLNMKNYKGYDKMPYCEAHYPKATPSAVVDTPEMRRLAENTKLQSQVKYQEEFNKSKGQKIEVADDPEIMRHLRNTQVQSQVAYHGEYDKKKHQDEIRPSVDQSKITSSSNPQTTESYANAGAMLPGGGGHSENMGGSVASTPHRDVGSIANYDPMNGNWGTVGSTRVTNNNKKIGSGQANKISTAAASQNQPLASVGSQSSSNALGRKNSETGFTVKAIYDYKAADDDEVSFLEGDIIVNCKQVDDGWMIGTVQKTLMQGMLPANYVKIVKQPTNLHYLC